jgi:endonuclease/exonuclease/phosphatase family metal-dependent hydrolase
MAKLFSFASWNVEQFHGQPERVDRVVEVLAEHDPDVFAIFEVKGRDVFSALMSRMPGHLFTITESTSPIEILVGVRRTIQAFVTQRDELQSKVPTLRPGALATLRDGEDDYPFLFLHPKSFDHPRDWGLRDDMFAHAASLKRTLDKAVAPGRRANFIVMGDLNTMGLNAAWNPKSDLEADEEIAFLENRMRSVKMVRLTKTHEASWWNGKDKPGPSKLDHAFAAEHLRFRSFDGHPIKVIGWPTLSDADAQRQWIESFSDHAMLYGEIEA